MCETKFLQMCSFSIILTSVHLFPVLFYIISTTILKFPQCTATLIPNNFCISTQSTRIPTLIPCTRIPIPFLVFPPLFSAFLSFPYPIPHFGYYRQPAQFVIFKDLFQENSCLVPKQAPLSYYSITFGTKLSFTSSVLSPKTIYLIVPQVKNPECLKCYLSFMSKRSIICPKQI